MFMVLGLFSRMKKLPLHRSGSPVRREVAQLSNGAVGAARFVPIIIVYRSNQTPLWPTLYTWNAMIVIRQTSSQTNECKITLILIDCGMNGIIMSGLMFQKVTPSDNINSPQSFDVKTVSQFNSLRGDVRRESGLREFASIRELGCVMGK